MQQSSNQPQITETEILQMLHPHKMTMIKERFMTKEKGLPINDFLAVMLEHLEYDKHNAPLKMAITVALIDFFKQVDVNGDQTMEWEEFSNHIIELGLLRNDRSFKNVIKCYFPTDRVIDRQKHELGIESVYYFQKLKNIFMFQRDCSKFKVYGVNQANLLYEVNAHKGNILDMQFLQNQNLIATSSNDLTINFWDASSFTLKQIVSVPEIQLKIRYANWKQTQKQLLYTGGSDSIIHIYDAYTLKQKGTISGWNPFFKSDQQQIGHCAPIGDILPIDSQQILVTACLGGSICLWDATNHQFKKDLRGHDKGVYSLDWCDWSQMNNCLLSAGLDHEAFVWNTYVRDKIFLLRGHNNPLVGVKCLPGSPQIITADISGMVKIWDVRNFLCMQTFNMPVQQLSSFCLTYSTISSQPMKKRIIGAGKKLYYFEYDEPKDQLLTDEKPCLKVLFNSTLLCFITMHGECVKVWDGRYGKLISVYRGLSNINSELTTMILDIRERKLFMGDSEGNIYTVNIKNGAKMKQFQKHNNTVTGLGCWSSDNSNISDERYNDLRRIISISMDPEVFIHDEDAPQDAKSSCRYIMKQHKKSCNSISVKYGSDIIATGSDDGHTIITNLISYRHQLLPSNSNSEIKHVLFLDPYECLITIDINGNMVFYGIGQSKYRNKILFQKQYQTQSMTNKIQPFPVTALAFTKDFKILILGDEFGHIQCWDMSIVLEGIQKSKVEKGVPILKKQKKKHRKSEDFMVTEVKTGGNFNADMMVLHLQLKSAHNDGVTSVEIVAENQAFITSSFDCCCHIWSIKDGARLGSLLLGGDPNWKLSFDLELRRAQAKKEAQELLLRIGKKKSMLLDHLGSEQNYKQFQNMKEGVLRGAKELLDSQRRGFAQDQYNEFSSMDDNEDTQNLINELLQSKNHMQNKKTVMKSRR